MTLSFQPQTEEEVLNLLKPGIYSFEVKVAEDAVSKKGNPMIRLSMVTWDDKGRERYITDYLMTAMMFKIKHFCEATGLEDKYNAGSFSAADCVGKAGKFKLRIDDGQKSGYAPKNEVQDYVKEAPAQAANDFLDDDIPL